MPLPNSPVGGGSFHELPPESAQARDRIPGFKPEWRYAVSPTEMQVIAGEVLPFPAQITIRPGVNGTTATGDSSVAEASQGSRLGRIVVPLSVQVVAWGAKRTGYLVAYDGTRGRYHVSAWQRPRRLGASIVWDVDWDGWIGFLRQLKTMYLSDTIDPLVAEATLAPLLAEIASLEGPAQHNPAAARRLAELRARLPKAAEPAASKKG